MTKMMSKLNARIKCYSRIIYNYYSSPLEPFNKNHIFYRSIELPKPHIWIEIIEMFKYLERFEQHSKLQINFHQTELEPDFLLASIHLGSMLGALLGILLEVDGCSKSFGWSIAVAVVAIVSVAVFEGALLEASFEDKVAFAVAGVIKLHGTVFVTKTHVGCTVPQLLPICTTES